MSKTAARLRRTAPFLYDALKGARTGARHLVQSVLASNETLRRTECAWRLRRDYRTIHGHKLDVAGGQDFTARLFRRMIETGQNGNPFFTELADKFRARAYAAERIGDQHLIALLWHGEDPSQIPFDRLPRRYVIKTNHGSGGNIVVDGEADRPAAIRQLRAWLRENYYWHEREYHYFDIRPRVLIEAFVDDGHESGPLDYRFFCFGGRPAVVQVDNHAHDINPFYDPAWNRLDLCYRSGCRNIDLPPPPGLDTMRSIAERLAAGIDFVRVDLYNVAGHVLFGEMTLTPAAGRFRLSPGRWDRALGQLWPAAG